MTMKTVSTILVCGGSGLIGRHLCNNLITKGYQVKILSRTSSPVNNLLIPNMLRSIIRGVPTTRVAVPLSKNALLALSGYALDLRD